MAESAVGTAPQIPGRGTVAVPGDGGSRLFLTRLGIAAISTASCTIGLLPSIMYLDRGSLIVIAIAIVGFMALVAAFQIQPTHLNQPGALEFIAAGLSAISQGALVSVMALVSYISVRGLHWATNWVLGWVGLSLPFGWSRPALLFALAVGGIGLLGAVVPTVKGVWRALYPPVAGFPTPFRDFARSRMGQAALAAAVVAAIAFTVFAFAWPLSRLGFWPCLIIAYLLAGATMFAWSMSQEKTAPRTFTTSEDAISAMLRAMGYLVVEQPRTGLPEIDPYLAELDFAVSSDDRVFAMLIQKTDAARRSDLQCVAQVLIAARALADGTKKLGGNLPPVEPVLLLIGATRGEDLSSFEYSNRVLVLRLQEASELQTASQDEQALRVRGEQIFAALAGPRPGSAAARAAAPTAAASQSGVAR